MKTLYLALLLTIVIFSGCKKKSLDDSLLEATRKGNINKMRVHLMKGANVNARVKKIGITPIIIASRKGNMKVLEFLVERGADINSKDRRWRTPLMWASWKGHPEIVEYLISKKAKINEKARLGFTALMYAEKYKHKDIINRLKEVGAVDLPVGHIY